MSGTVVPKESPQCAGGCMNQVDVGGAHSVAGYSIATPPSSPLITHSLSTSSEASLLVFERRYAGQVNLGC